MTPPYETQAARKRLFNELFPMYSTPESEARGPRFTPYVRCVRWFWRFARWLVTPTGNGGMAAGPCFSPLGNFALILASAALVWCAWNILTGLSASRLIGH